MWIRESMTGEAKDVSHHCTYWLVHCCSWIWPWSFTFGKQFLWPTSRKEQSAIRLRSVTY